MKTFLANVSDLLCFELLLFQKIIHQLTALTIPSYYLLIQLTFNQTVPYSTLISPFMATTSTVLIQKCNNLSNQLIDQTSHN